jgi:hypothetical protein
MMDTDELAAHHERQRIEARVENRTHWIDTASASELGVRLMNDALDPEWVDVMRRRIDELKVRRANVEELTAAIIREEQS